MLLFQLAYTDHSSILLSGGTVLSSYTIRNSVWLCAVSYPLDLVSQCPQHAVALLWALLCVCGASVVRSHPHDRLRKDIYIIFNQPFTTSHYILKSKMCTD